MGDSVKLTETVDKNMMKGIRLRWIRALFLLINILCVIPILVIACFNVPSADDFSMAFEVHEAYLNTGSVFSAVFEAIYMGFWYYMNWTGYFFSDAVTALSPAVFGEQMYFVGTFVILFVFTFGLWLFMRMLLTRVLGLEVNLAGCITSVTYFLLLQCMPEGLPRCESFFWYSGAVNYMFMFGLALLWLGLLIRLVTSHRIKTYQTILLSVLGFLLGGANYMTGLSLAIISVCILFISAVVRILTWDGAGDDGKLRKIAVIDACFSMSSLQKVIAPAICMIIGFIIAVIAPGNRVRAEEPKFGAIKAVMISIYYTLENMFGEWLTWPVVILIAILIPFLWKAAGRAMRICSFEHPLLFASFAFLISAANITPPVYATGNIDAGRIVGIYYMQSMLSLVLMIGYCCGWIQNVLRRGKEIEPKEKKSPMELIFEGYLGNSASRVLICAAAVFVIGSLLSIKADPYFYTSSAAIADIRNGSAKTYRQEADNRLLILKDESVTDAELKPFTVRPELLFFSDITTDKNDWLNKAVAEYYHKDSVILKETD